MISKITIQNFKSLQNIELDCANLNLLTGLNSMGKSSIIQALLLLRQSFDKGHLRTQGIILNGDLVKIGSGRDALSVNAEKEEISFNLSFLNKPGNYNWAVSYELNRTGKEHKYFGADSLPFADDASIPENIDELPIFTPQFKYLNAERWVKNQYDMSDRYVIQNKNLGIHGEYTAHYLYHFGPMSSERVDETLMYPKTEARELDYQVSAWMNEISPGTKVNVAKVHGADAIKLSYRYGKDEFNATNVGFGVTYSLSVVVALLSAKPGDILVIENPESHVHPQGQSAIGRLMGSVAQTGVQIFVESHSDHILNGVCVAIHKKQLKKENARFFFLHKKFDEVQTTRYEIPVAQNGRIDDSILKKNGIDGFFDQIDKDIDTILFTA